MKKENIFVFQEIEVLENYLKWVMLYCYMKTLYLI